jgi:hypothetical protein
VIEVHDGWADDSPVVTKRILMSGFGLTLAVVLTAVVIGGKGGDVPSPAESTIVKGRFPVETAHSVHIGGLGISDGRIRIEGVLRGATLRPWGEPRRKCRWSVYIRDSDAIIAAGGRSLFIALPDRGMFVSRRCGGWYSAK